MSDGGATAVPSSKRSTAPTRQACQHNGNQMLESGYQFTLRAQKNSQDSVRITDEVAVPKSYCRIDARIDGFLWETVLSVLPEELARALE